MIPQRLQGQHSAPAPPGPPALVYDFYRDHCPPLPQPGCALDILNGCDCDIADAPLRFSKSLAAAVQWDWDHARIPAACVNNRGACPVNFTTSVFYYLTNTTRTQARGRLYSGL